MIDKDLQALGLNEKEAKVYLASLELGQATVQNIAAKASIKRPTTYFIIESLMERGLMSSFYQGKRQYFLAETPERIADVIDKEISDLEIRKESFKRLLPELQSLNNRNKSKPVVKYYEGKEGILTMVSEHIKTSRNQETFSAFSRDAILECMTEEDLARVRKERLHHKVKVRAIYTWDNGNLEQNIPDTNVIKLSSKDFPVSCDIAVYEDKVRIASFRDRVMGIVIEDKEIAKSFKAVFKLAWEHVKGDARK